MELLAFLGHCRYCYDLILLSRASDYQISQVMVEQFTALLLHLHYLLLFSLQYLRRPCHLAKLVLECALHPPIHTLSSMCLIKVSDAHDLLGIVLWLDGALLLLLVLGGALGGELGGVGGS